MKEKPQAEAQTETEVLEASRLATFQRVSGCDEPTGVEEVTRKADQESHIRNHARQEVDDEGH